MAPKYANAADVLPGELLTAVREKLGKGGCFLWVPSEKNTGRERRNRYVVQLYQKGYSAADIADRLFISERTVWRILARARSERAKSAGAAGPQRTAESDGSDD